MFPYDTINFIITLIIIARVVSLFRKPTFSPSPDEDENSQSDDIDS